MSMGVCSDGSLQMGKFGDTDRQNIQTTLLFFPHFASSPGEDTYSRVSFELASKQAKQSKQSRR